MLTFISPVLVDARILFVRLFRVVFRILISSKILICMKVLISQMSYQKKNQVKMKKVILEVMMMTTMDQDDQDLKWKRKTRSQR